jgi:hypothetical protein
MIAEQSTETALEVIVVEHFFEELREKVGNEGTVPYESPSSLQRIRKLIHEGTVHGRPVISAHTLQALSSS